MISRFVGGVLVALPLGNAFWNLVGSIAEVNGRSMQPTLNPNPTRRDFIFLNKLDKYNVSRGDIVVMISPTSPELRLVKRVLAVEGDIVTKMGIGSEVVRIPDGHIWVEGDRGDQSVDSKHFGPIPLGLVVGKVTWIIWPIDRIQNLSNSKLAQ